MENKYPVLMRPYLKDAVWGGKRLVTEFGKRAEGSLAESWELSDFDCCVSVAEAGCHKGKGFNELHRLFAPDSPSVLIKFIDSDSDLSVQVHPSDECGDAKPKNECWYIIQAEPDARIAYGLKRELTPQMLKSAVDDGTLSDELGYVEVTAGDFFYVPAGLIHAIGKGITLLEIQQPSDTTYRIYDYCRRDINGDLRPLHIDDAVASYRYFTHAEIDSLRFSEKHHDTPDGCLTANRYFSVFRSVSSFKVCEYTQREAAITFLSSGILLLGEKLFAEAKKGETFYIPPKTDCTAIGDDIILTTF